MRFILALLLRPLISRLRSNAGDSEIELLVARRQLAIYQRSVAVHVCLEFLAEKSVAQHSLWNDNRRHGWRFAKVVTVRDRTLDGTTTGTVTGVGA